MNNTAVPGGAPATRPAISVAEAQRIAMAINNYMAHWPTPDDGKNPFLGARVTLLRVVRAADKTLWVPEFDRPFFTSLVFVADEQGNVEQIFGVDMFIQRDLYPGEVEEQS